MTPAAHPGRALLQPAHTIASMTTTVADLLAPMFGREASSEARDLVALLYDMPKHWTSTARDSVTEEGDWHRALSAASKRARGAPLQYAVGRAHFRHLTLDVDERVLIPRPETEQLVDIVLDRTKDSAGGTVVDVGTGSGAIAIALASEGTFDRVIATDVSADAIALASGNAERHAGSLRARVEFRVGSLLAPVREGGVRVIVSNPPYISYDEADALPAGVRDWEPSVALFSGSEGIALTSALIRQAATVLAPDGLLALETDVRRAALVAELAASHGAFVDVEVLLDLTGRERFVVARRGEELG